MIGYFRTIGGFPFPVKLFLATELFFGLGIGIWSINLNFHLKANGFSEADIGMILSVGSLLTAFLSLMAGQLCDRMGYHPAMWIGNLLKGSGMIIIAVFPWFNSAVLGQIVFSVGESLVLSCEFPFILGLVSPEFRNMVYSLLISFYLFAMFLGNLFGGYMNSIFYIDKKPYFISVLISGILIIILGILRIFLPKVKSVERSGKFFIYYIGNPKIIRFVIYGILVGMVYNILSSMTNLVYRKQFGLSDGEIGIILAVSTVAGCVSAFLAPELVKRFSHKKIAVMAQIINIIFFLVMSAASFGIFTASWIVTSFTRNLMPASIDSLMLQSIPEPEQGVYSGIRIFGNYIGMGIGAYLAGSIIMYSGTFLLMIAAAVASIAQMCVYLFGCRRFLN